MHAQNSGGAKLRLYSHCTFTGHDSIPAAVKADALGN